MFYMVYHYLPDGMVMIDFVTNDRVIAIDKHQELGGWDTKHYITGCPNSEIV